LRINYNAQTLPRTRGSICALKFIVIFAALTIVSLSASAQVHAEEGRIHITFLKTEPGSGSGYLFYQGQKYGIAVKSPQIRKIWITTIDLIGTASNLRDAADIIGTYNAADAGVATIRGRKIVRLENAKGVVLEIRAVNLHPWFTLNLFGMSVKSLGWQPSE
jgi:hypothetical protein